MEKLPGRTIRKLRGLAQRLEPTLKLGKSGLTDGFVESLNTVLSDKELVKVKFVDFKDRKKEFANILAERTVSHLITMVGHVAVFYRQHPEPSERTISV